MTTAPVPRSPADRRQGGVPYYIPNRCNDCGSPLMPDPDSEANGWLDEFICARSCEGLYIDEPLDVSLRCDYRSQ